MGAAIEDITSFLDGHRVLYAAPTGDQTGSYLEAVCKILDDGIRQKTLICNKSTRTIRWNTEKYPSTPSSAQIRARTAYNADTLRGGYADRLTLDEWQMMEESAWEEVAQPMLIDNGGYAKLIYTPLSTRMSRGSKLKDRNYIKRKFIEAEDDPDWSVHTFTSHDNPHIDHGELDLLSKNMSSVTFRQEILAEDIDEIPGALWVRKDIEDHRIKYLSTDITIDRLAVGVDPTGSQSNEAGIVAGGIGSDGRGYVLMDRSLKGSTQEWGAAVIKCAKDVEAGVIVVERNFGGDMAREVISSQPGAENFTIKEVNASRGKAVRAEPISVRYERGEISHVGHYPDLEDEMCSWVPGIGMPSPNRIDALVWAMTEVMLVDNEVLYGFV